MHVPCAFMMCPFRDFRSMRFWALLLSFARKKAGEAMTNTNEKVIQEAKVVQNMGKAREQETNKAEKK